MFSHEFELQIKIISSVTGSMLMFVASVQSSQTVSSPNKILFSNAVTNIGGGYSTATSEFTCLVPGYYMFAATVLAQPSLGVYAQITSTTGIICSSFLAYQTSSAYNSASSTCMLHCAQGQRVWVRATYTSYVHQVFSSFAGALIRSDS